MDLMNTGSLDSLAVLAARAVSGWRPLEEIAACLDVLPRFVRHEILAHLSHERLRGLEICWSEQRSCASKNNKNDRNEDNEDEDDTWSLESETEHEWRLRSIRGANSDAGANSDPAAAPLPGSRKRSFRQAFWEHRFRLLLRAEHSPTQLPTSDADVPRTSARSISAADATEDLVGVSSLPLFQDVVSHLKMHGREVVPRNVALIATLRQLHRLEVHHPEQHKTCWRSLVSLVATHVSLTELCFFHGRLSDVQLQQLRSALATRAASTTPALRAIATIELVSLTIRLPGHRELVALVSERRELTTVRLSACLGDFGNDVLVAHTLALPRLETLSLAHNHLGDDAFTGLRTCQSRLALRTLTLDSNAVSVPTLRGLCTAALAGVLSLERLELRNNSDMGDASVAALAPMLAATDASLTHLNLFNCGLELDGATTLLRALCDNVVLTHVDISHNFVGSGFGDVLAAFLRANTTLRSLRMNYVGLGSAGCTVELQDALASNSGLKELAIGANRVRDSGAEVLFQALVTRSLRVKTPYASVDLSGNLMTHKGLRALANTVERLSFDDSHQEGRQDGSGGRSTVKTDDYDVTSRDERRAKRRKLLPPLLASSALWIQELNLLDNNFPRDADANEPALRALRSRVAVVRTNTWVGKRNVYDDEV